MNFLFPPPRPTITMTYHHLKGLQCYVIRKGVFYFSQIFCLCMRGTPYYTLLCRMYVEKAMRIHKYTHNKVLQLYLLGYRHDVEECVIFSFKISIANVVDFSCFCRVRQGYHIEG